MLISVNGLNKSFGERQVLNNISFTIEDSARYGLIGVNGAGKSTLLNIITDINNNSNEVYKRSNLSIGYLKQNTGLDKESSILTEMQKAFNDVLGAENELRQLEDKMSKLSDHTGTEYKRILAEYTKKQAYFDSRDGYSIDVKIKTVLNGMGFSDKDSETLIKTLSGGEKTRLAIAKLLLEEPELLILDEPTNHLDFKTLNWLEEYLASYKGAILIVSHDRYFLDKTVNNILELERGHLFLYKGNYSSYLIQKRERLALLKKQYDAQQAEILKLQTYVDKNISRASTVASARSRQKVLDNLEIIEYPEYTQKQIKLKFDILKESYKDVLKVDDLSLCVGSESHLLCSGICLDIKKHDKIAVIGDNGIGKSTFLKTIQGLIPHFNGSYTWGKNTDIGYYEQENLNLDYQKKAIDELWDRFPHIPEAQIRKYLGNVCLTQKDVFKPVGILSGGERARLALCILMLEKSNVMLLDEPTNHLDLSSKEVLEAALKDYQGTLIFVSHDRYLLNKIPDKIVEITKNGAIIYDGKYDYYLEKKRDADIPSIEEKTTKPEKNNGGHKSKEQRRNKARQMLRIKEIEKRISELENENELLQSELLTEGVYSDYKKASEKTERLENNTLELENLYTEWESLQEEMDTNER